MQHNLIILVIAIVSVVLALCFFFFKKKSRKTKSSDALFLPQNHFAARLKSAFSGQEKQLQDVIPTLEETLLTADVGIAATEKLIHTVFTEHKAKTVDESYAVLKNEIARILTPTTEFKIDATKKPFVIYLVGVNGVGKTTTIGKLASQFKAQGFGVMMVAADTFRAAAVEQLRVWADRNQVDFVGGQANADPSSVIVDGLRSAQSKNIDVVLVDTAGRLHTKSNLMQELQKMVRMSEKVLNRNPDEIFLVVDAITGQNGFSQAKVFLEAIPVSGVVLTKYDATSKGGIIISIADQTGIPIRYLGLGEKIEDLRPFQAKDFVDKLFAA
jgi:fused signal recognition particle receptor